MPELSLLIRWHRSIFAKLLAIMIAVLVSLFAMVAVIFSMIVGPSLSNSWRLTKEYARTLAVTAPDLATAQRLAGRLDLQIRYEGPDGAWTTSPGLPTVREVQSHPGRHDVYLAPDARGGTYLVSWETGRRMRRAHDRLISLLLVLVAIVIFTAHAVLRRALSPLRELHQGVMRLSEGHLDVIVPSRTRDEFGGLTDAFNQMVCRIGDMLRARDQLLLDVSHELRSPLTRMKVALALLPDGDKKQRIAADVSEMEAMITEILELERLREGHGIKTSRRDLLPIVREVAESFQVPVAATAAEILLDLDGDRIRTVLRNLLENAIKYSLPDSQPVEISVEETPETATVRVTDDGPGIPEADLPSLFEPFFRVDRSRSKKSGGYGLGLSICKRIAEAHGGTVTAANRPGRRGSVFTLTLPKPPNLRP
jgi:signal transduction histidine kinase